MKCKECGGAMVPSNTDREIDGPHVYVRYTCANGHSVTRIYHAADYYAELGCDDCDTMEPY